jgi:hypothetical protein
MSVSEASVAEPTPAAQPVHAQRDGQHDFDFNVGSWKSHIRRLLHPLSGSATWVEYAGSVLVRTVWGGRANLEEVEASGPAGHLEFVEIRLYNTESHQWSINNANNRDGVIEQPPLIGDFDSGRGLFYDQEFYKGRAIFVRQIWTHPTSTAYSMVQSFSDDGGATWEDNFIANVTRDP